MRIRTAAPTLVGALALGALAVPTAASATTPSPVVTHASASTLVLGLTGTASQVIRISATDPAGIKSIKAVPWPDQAARGAYPITAADVASSPALPVVSRTAAGETAGMTDTETYNVRTLHIPNAAAGMVFDIAVLVTGKDGRTTFAPKAATFTMFERADSLTAKPSAAAVHRGASVTVSGRLNRADWDKDAWTGYAGRWVALQFRPSGSRAWTTVRWVRTSSTGALSTSVRDHRSGSWRYVYGGDAASGAAASATAWVTVK